MNLTPAQQRLLAWLALGLTLFGLLWLLAPVLSPFVAAAVMAYALAPLVERCSRRMPRVLAVVLIELAVIALVLLLFLMVVPILVKEMPLLREQIPLMADKLNASLAPTLAQFDITLALDVESIKAFLLKHVGANSEDVMAAVLGSVKLGGSVLLALIGNMILIPVVLFYLLMDWPNLLARIWTLVPPKYRQPAAGFLGEVDNMLGHYLRGQLLVMGVLAVFYSATLAIAGFELAIPLGVFTGAAVFIPYVGFGLGLVLALMAGVLQFASLYGVLAVAVIFGIGQLLESFVLTPRLVGERIGLSPLMVIFVLLAFGHLLGFVGVLVALPLSAIGLVALARARRSYMASGLYRG